MTPLSIAIFGNTNNYPLLLAQGLKVLGHNVHLIINRKELLHRPESRYQDWAAGYPDWISDYSNVTEEDIAYKTPAIDPVIYALTHKTDLVILNDVGLALADSIHIPYVAFLTGSDLAYYADFDSLIMRTQIWDAEFKRSLQGRRYLKCMTDLVARQRDGIVAAELVCYAYRGLIPAGDKLLDGIGVSDTRRHMLYISNTLDLQQRPAANNEKLTILCGSRIVYRPQHHPALSAIDFKGVDALLNGFALFCKNGGRGELRLPRKGQDVEAALALIAELDIEDSVIWLDEMPLSRFYEEMIAADLVCDQFGTSFPGMITADAYALGRPVMADFRNDIFSRHGSELMPGFNAESPQQICEHLMMLDKNRSVLAKIGRKSRAYAEKYLSPEGVASQLLKKVFPGKN